jgi:hypothetical protein
MNSPSYNYEINIPHQVFYKDFKPLETKNIEKYGAIGADGPSPVFHEENLRVAKGITYALLFCIPFWLFILIFVIKLI